MEYCKPQEVQWAGKKFVPGNSSTDTKFSCAWRRLSEPGRALAPLRAAPRGPAPPTPPGPTTATGLPASARRHTQHHKQHRHRDIQRRGQWQHYNHCRFRSQCRKHYFRFCQRRRIHIQRGKSPRHSGWTNPDDSHGRQLADFQYAPQASRHGFTLTNNAITSPPCWISPAQPTRRRTSPLRVPTPAIIHLADLPSRRRRLPQNRNGNLDPCRQQRPPQPVNQGTLVVPNARSR